MQISQLGGNPIVMGGETLLDTYYPVGRIYLSSENVSPASFMGGSWERIEDVFLLCAGTTYAAGSTGGNMYHTHLYGVRYSPYYGVACGNSENMLMCKDYPNDNYIESVITSHTSLNNVNSSLTNGQTQMTTSSRYSEGVSSSTSNMPPYRAVYAWERVA